MRPIGGGGASKEEEGTVTEPVIKVEGTHGRQARGPPWPWAPSGWAVTVGRGSVICSTAEEIVYNHS